MNINIDFKNVKTLKDMHYMLKEIFGFPDFYGYNVNALIDCLGDLRYPDYGMSKITLRENEILYIFIYNFPFHNDIICNNFLVAISNVNQKNIINGENPSISLFFL